MKPGSKGWKKFMAKLYGIGAAVVIVGALFKIEHWPFASALLTVGLSTEAVIFFFSAFEPPHEEPDWSLVYPELALPENDKMALKKQNVGKSISKGGSSVSAQLDNMLAEAKIEPELIASLGDGLRSFSSQARQLSDVSEAATASTEYATSLRSASQKVSTLADNYAAVSEALTGLSSHAEDSKTAGRHLQKMSENLSSLNNMYELQLVDLEKSKVLFGDMFQLMKNLSDSVEDTKQYKENIATLSQNLKSLNTVYSNMLNAMGTARA
ncbi:MAG: gliding motility protein GldL [Flavobacteriales bacterium]|nr:gliding motility protein GldL [Flavobacteriales bacterium]